MLVLAFCLSGLLLLFGGIVTISKWVDQRTRDRNRRTYRLAFPSTLEPEMVAGFLNGISGSMKAKGMLNGVPSIAFELWGTNRGIVHLIKIPWQYEEHIISPLLTLIPGLRLIPEEEKRTKVWVHAEEFGITNSHRMMRVGDDKGQTRISANILSRFRHLGDGETLVMQWVVTPAAPEHKVIHGETQTKDWNLNALILGDAQATPEEVADRNAKSSETNFIAVLRIGAVANTKERAKHLVHGIHGAIDSARGPATHLVHKVVMVDIADRINRATAPSTIGRVTRIATSELTAFLGWRLRNPLVPGLAATVSRALPAPESVPREGRVLGRSTMSGNERPIAVSFEESRKHVWLLGGTGAGKTSLLRNMARQDIKAGHGVVVFDMKGDLYDRLLDDIPPDRMANTILMDISDLKRPVGYNVLEQGDRGTAIDSITEILKAQYSGSLWTDLVLQHSLRTVAEKNLTLMDVPALLMPVTEDDVAWREQMIRDVRDPELAAFWQRINKEGKVKGEQIGQPAWDRLQLLAGRQEIKNILGQQHSSFYMDDVIKNRKILFVRMAGVPKASASLLGTMLFDGLWEAVKRNRSEKQTTFLYLDECHHYMDIPVDLEEMLVESRSMGLGLVLAHQNLSQLKSREMQSVVMSNARTKAVFQLAHDDARAVAQNFGSSITEEDLLNLAKYEMVGRVSTDFGISAPLTLNTVAEPNPHETYGKAKQVIYEARQKYGRPIQAVQQEMSMRRVTETATSRRKPPRPDDERKNYGIG